MSVFIFKIFSLLASITFTCGFDLTILHTNDVHARFEQFNKYGSQCSESDARDGKCFGGVARRQTKVNEIRGTHGNVLLLDAGDQFVGTTWFSVYRGNATSFFMNKLGYDAMCLGNHEFDHGAEGLAPFLEKVNFTVVSANTDVTNESHMLGKFQKTWIHNIGGEQIAVIGYTTPETKEISAPGPQVKFTDIADAVRTEVISLNAQGINKVIALGHAGFTVDKQVAAIDGVDLVIGGHSNTFLFNGEQPDDEVIQGPYPVIVDQAGGGKGLVVQDYQMGKYLGYLNLTFDTNGVVTVYSGNPILLDHNVHEDEEILQLMRDWKVLIDQIGKKVIGFSNVVLSDDCLLQECNFGNLITDAIIDHHVNYSHSGMQWAPSAVAVWNGGGIRSSVGKGILTSNDAMYAMPFGNTIDLITVSGRNLRGQLEHSVHDMNVKEPHGRFLQMSGIRVVYNLQKPIGKRVVSVQVRCLDCNIPSYSPLDDNKEYKMFVSSFLLNGGDGYRFIPTKRQRFNTLDVTTLTEYVKKHSPVYPSTEGRIQFENDSVTAGAPSLSLKLSQIIYLICFGLLTQVIIITGIS